MGSGDAWLGLVVEAPMLRTDDENHLAGRRAIRHVPLGSCLPARHALAWEFYAPLPDDQLGDWNP